MNEKQSNGSLLGLGFGDGGWHEWKLPEPFLSGGRSLNIVKQKDTFQKARHSDRYSVRTTFSML